MDHARLKIGVLSAALKRHAYSLGFVAFVASWSLLVAKNWHWVIALPVVLALWLSLLAVEAHIIVKGAKKEDAFVCDKHGLIPKKAAFRVVEENLEYTTPEGQSRYGPILYCPLCFEERIKQAKKQ